jgi:hypothetical protein
MDRRQLLKLRNVLNASGRLRDLRGRVNLRGSATVTDLTASQTILAQLGGESFVVTSGAAGFVASGESLTFKPGRNPRRVTHVRVTVTHDGLYDLTFFTIGKGPRSYDGVHGEMLQEVFAANTGLVRDLRASA